jgi:hypothetical protein
MAQCPSCQAKFVGAKVCPACGMKQPMSIEKKVGLGIVVVVVALIGISIGGGGANKAASPSAGQSDLIAAGIRPDEGSTTKITPIGIPASKLYEAYDANEVSADDKYKNRLLVVGGLVKSIDKDFRDDIIVRLAGNRFSTVDAYIIESEKAKSAALVKGQEVFVLCRCDGRMVGSPILKGCSFVASPPAKG